MHLLFKYALNTCFFNTGRKLCTYVCMHVFERVAKAKRENCYVYFLFLQFKCIIHSLHTTSYFNYNNNCSGKITSSYMYVCMYVSILALLVKGTFFYYSLNKYKQTSMFTHFYGWLCFSIVLFSIMSLKMLLLFKKL